MITLLASSLHPTLSPQTITWWWHLEVRTKSFQYCCIFFHKEGRQCLLFSPAWGHPGRLQDCRCSRRSEQLAPFEVRSAWNCQASNQWPGRLWSKFHFGIHLRFKLTLSSNSVAFCFKDIWCWKLRWRGFSFLVECFVRLIHIRSNLDLIGKPLHPISWDRQRLLGQKGLEWNNR